MQLALDLLTPFCSVYTIPVDVKDKTVAKKYKKYPSALLKFLTVAERIPILSGELFSWPGCSGEVLS